MCVNGEATIGDNIADINGMKAAFLAYRYVARILGGDIPMPQLVTYTSDQIFFMSAIRQYCTRNDPTAQTLISDVHTPDRARIEICMRNVPQFAQAFHCEVGSNTVVSKPCPLWGDFSESFGPKKSTPQEGKKPKEEDTGEDENSERK